MLDDIKREFEINNPKLVYVDHEKIGTDFMGVGFLFISDHGKVYCGVRAYPIENGKVLWNADIHTFSSWKDVSRKALDNYITKGR